MRVLALLIVWICPHSTTAQPSPEEARRLFSAADVIATEDDGRLWQIDLQGPLLLADPDSRLAFSSDAAPGFELIGDIWRGRLPDTVAIANTAVFWGGIRRTMLRWPLPETDGELRRLLAHEMWHRVQTDLGFPSSVVENGHLAVRDGRFWLILEMRALARALRNDSEDQAVVGGAIADALAFRARRLKLFPEARAEETALLMHEGLAQYTGYALSGLTPIEARQRAAQDLDQAETEDPLIRTFAYAMGSAYGLLLDRHSADWRRQASSNTSMADLLRPTPSDSDSALAHYNGSLLALQEDARESERQLTLQSWMTRYVDGPRLLLTFQHMNVSFDPGEVDVLDGHGSIYQTMVLTDDWGRLTVRGGALILSDWSGVVVPAPAGSEGIVEGDGYKLELNPEWTLAPRDGVMVAERR